MKENCRKQREYITGGQVAEGIGIIDKISWESDN